MWYNRDMKEEQCCGNCGWAKELKGNYTEMNILCMFKIPLPEWFRPDPRYNSFVRKHFGYECNVWKPKKKKHRVV